MVFLVYCLKDMRLLLICKVCQPLNQSFQIKIYTYVYIHNRQIGIITILINISNNNNNNYVELVTSSDFILVEFP